MVLLGDSAAGVLSPDKVRLWWHVGSLGTARTARAAGGCRSLRPPPATLSPVTCKEHLSSPWETSLSPVLLPQAWLGVCVTPPSGGLSLVTDRPRAGDSKQLLRDRRGGGHTLQYKVLGGTSPWGSMADQKNSPACQALGGVGGTAQLLRPERHVAWQLQQGLGWGSRAGLLPTPLLPHRQPSVGVPTGHFPREGDVLACLRLRFP